MNATVRRPLCLLALVLLVAGLFAPNVAGAAPSTPAGGEQGEREQVTQQREKVISQIDLLKASDVELQVEVNRLGNVVKTEEANVAAARLSLADLESKLGGLADEVDQAKRDAEAARRRAAERAVDAYMYPGVDAMAAVLEAKDYDQAHRRRTLIAEVAQFDREVLQGQLEAQQALAARQGRLSDAQRRADELRQEAEDDLATARAAQAKQAETRRALDSRIADFQAEASDLAAEEANLTAIIQRREAETKAQAAKELAAAPASAPTTAGPAPTAAPAAARPVNPSAPASIPPRAPAPTAAPPTTAPSASGTRFLWPLTGSITSPFGMRWGRLHAGIDIGVPTGTPIRAAAAGTVFSCGDMGAYGLAVLIDHGNGLVTLYAHQNNLACSNGQRVSAGQVIGYAGNTGRSTGPHLHFEVRRNGTAVDPMQYLG